MVYLTVSSGHSSVYRSQVIGACEYLRQDLGIPIKLVTLTGLRRVGKAKRSLNRQYPDATALPIFPGDLNSRRNRLILRTYFRSRPCTSVIARCVRATEMALYLRDRGLIRSVCYDGRGATAAEAEEYSDGFDPERKKRATELERAAVLNSDFRLAVSDRLVAYWREQYGYEGRGHSVVPCALKPGEFPDPSAKEEERGSTRAALNFEETDVVLGYAGSLQGWQSLGELGERLRGCLSDRRDLKVLFLAREDPAITDLERAFPGQVRRRYVRPEEVHGFLSAADYGLLLRNPSTTNAVAAPTKFAEYLAAGLHVLISPGIGDYSDFVSRHGCGHLVREGDFPVARLERRSPGERRACASLAQRYFVRSSYRNEYGDMVDALGWPPKVGGVVGRAHSKAELNDDVF